MCKCMYNACITVCISVCITVWRIVCITVGMSACITVCTTVCITVCISVCITVCTWCGGSVVSTRMFVGLFHLGNWNFWLFRA